jgi:hypothetical protein
MLFKETLGVDLESKKQMGEMNTRLTREQWYELDEQYNKTPAQPEVVAVPGEHFKLIALLNRFGVYPMSKQEAMQLAGELLDNGWSD